MNSKLIYNFASQMQRVLISSRTTGVQSTDFSRVLFKRRKAQLKLVLYTPLINVPLLTVVQNWILAPNLRRGRVAHALNESRRARPRPVLPFLHVAVMHWIVMNVVH